MASPEVAFYTERLAIKEKQFADLQTAFNKYKLKHKVKLDGVRKEVAAYVQGQGLAINEKENAAFLLLRVAELEASLDTANHTIDNLGDELTRSQQLATQQLNIIRTLEEQLRLPRSRNEDRQFDVERMHQQIVYKDERILELNNVILDKERQIMDLQELCREQGEVANVKTQAMRIVQKKFEEIEGRSRRDVGTEIDPSLLNSSSGGHERGGEHTNRHSRHGRTPSPGTAVASRSVASSSSVSQNQHQPSSSKSGNSSPPPLDPSELDIDDIPQGFKGKNLDEEGRKKNRKRVTFDLPPTGSMLDLSKDQSEEDLMLLLVAFKEENDRLQAEIVGLKDELVAQEDKTKAANAEMQRLQSEGKSSNLKSRAVAQARIKELESKLSEDNERSKEEIEHLKIETETLRSTREWEVTQNAQLREQLAELKEKSHKLNEELDESAKSNRELEEKTAQMEDTLELMVDDLAQAESLINYLETQKHSILDDVDRLKEALFAQDQLIEILEADIVIYEEHIGILRESLGASKVDHRSLIRSKAFETKLKALEKEKEQSERKTQEERLRTKALDQKCRQLIEENERLMEKLCEAEMRHGEGEDIQETCRQLEVKLAEADDRAKLDRAEYELQLETSRIEMQRTIDELARELDTLRRAQEQESTRLAQEAMLAFQDQNVRLMREQSQQATVSTSHHHFQNGQSTHASQSQLGYINQSEGEKSRWNGCELNDTELMSKVSSQEAELRQRESALERLNHELRAQNELVERMQAENFELHSKIANLSESANRVQRLETDLRQASETIRTLMGDNQQLQNQIHQLHVQVQSQITQPSQQQMVENEIQPLRQQLHVQEQLQRAGDDTQRITSLETELAQTNETIRTLMEDRQQLQSQVQQYATQLSQLSAERGSTEETVRREQENLQKINEQEQKVQSLETELSQMNETIRALMEDRQQLQSQIQQYEAHFSQAAKEAKERAETEEANTKRERELLRSSTESEQRIAGLETELSQAFETIRAMMEDKEQLQSQLQQYDSQLTQLSDANAELEDKSEGQREELEKLRDELEHARLSLSETNEVKKELEMLREQLEAEQLKAKHQWQEVYRRLENTSIDSRKNSMEIQHQEYVLSYEQKIELIEEQLNEAKQKIESDKQEKNKLKAVIRQFKEKEEKRKAAEKTTKERGGGKENKLQIRIVKEEATKTAEQEDDSHTAIENYGENASDISRASRSSSKKSKEVIRKPIVNLQFSAAHTQIVDPVECSENQNQSDEGAYDDPYQHQLQSALHYAMSDQENIKIGAETQTARATKPATTDNDGWGNDGWGDEDFGETLEEKSKVTESSSQLNVATTTAFSAESCETPANREDDLSEKLASARLEARLSSELNVELSASMVEMEKQLAALERAKLALENELQKANIESNLQGMLVAELSDELDGIKRKYEELESLVFNLRQAKASTVAVAELHHGQDVQKEGEVNEENEWNENNSWKVEEEHITQNVQQESEPRGHSPELRASLDSAQRAIVELEERLASTEQRLEESQRVLRTYEIERMEEKERRYQELRESDSALIRATADTVEAVTLLRESAESESVSEVAASQQRDHTANGVSQSEYQEKVDELARLYKVKEELEKAVDALKAKVWTLKGDLKASILDREQLQDRVVELDAALEAAKRRADLLDVELQEQTELKNTAQRQAAEAENQSNRRLAECLEMETRREELEKAYGQLSSYYTQLQEAYNAIYARIQLTEQQELQQKQAVDDQRQKEETAFEKKEKADEEQEEIGRTITTILEVLDIPIDADASWQQKLEALEAHMRKMIGEIDQLRSALVEEKHAKQALIDRLDSLEEETTKDAYECETQRKRATELEKEFAWKMDECQSLTRRVNELEAALDAIAEREQANQGDNQEAARLSTRQADVDALFRTNAELAHTNVQLSNQLDEWEAITERRELERRSSEDESRGELANALAEIETLMARITSLQEEIATITQERDTIKTTYNELRATLREKKRQQQLAKENKEKSEREHGETKAQKKAKERGQGVESEKQIQEEQLQKKAHEEQGSSRELQVEISTPILSEASRSPATQPPRPPSSTSSSTDRSAFYYGQLRTSLGNAVDAVLADFERYFSLQDRNDRTVKEAVEALVASHVFHGVSGSRSNTPSKQK